MIASSDLICVSKVTDKTLPMKVAVARLTPGISVTRFSSFCATASLASLSMRKVLLRIAEASCSRCSSTIRRSSPSLNKLGSKSMCKPLPEVSFSTLRIPLWSVNW